jgi:hypothetical protein
MDIPIHFLVVILFGHWVGDFLLQWNEMALKKGTRLRWLGLHVLVYTFVLFLSTLFLFSPSIALKYCVINGVLHLFTDFVTSRLALRFADNPRVFFPILGFDQLIHSVTLLATALLMPTFSLSL